MFDSTPANGDFTTVAFFSILVLPVDNELNKKSCDSAAQKLQIPVAAVRRLRKSANGIMKQLIM